MKNPNTLAKSIYILSKKESSDRIVSSFLSYTKKRHLERIIPKIIHNLKNILEKENKLNNINITSAFELDKNKENKVKNIVNPTTNENQLTIIDKDIIGGVVINHKGYIYDFSVKNKIDKLKESLINN